MPKNRKFTYSDRQSQAARAKKQAVKKNAPDAKAQADANQGKGSAAEDSPKS